MERSREDLEIPKPKPRAQERYAQTIVDWLWGHPDMLEQSDGAIYFRGSMHNLVKEVIPRAQAGDVVNILRKSGAITHAGNGIWILERKSIFVDNDGNPVTFDVPSYGHDSRQTVLERNLRALGQRVTAVEEKLDALIRGLAEEREAS